MIIHLQDQFFGKTVNLDLGSGFNGHTLKIVATVSTSVVSAKTKTANTGETTTVNTQALAQADFISLGKADVYEVVLFIWQQTLVQMQRQVIVTLQIDLI